VAKPMLELLAGVPTVVYGFLAVNYVTPGLRMFFPDIEVYNAFSAGLVMGLMITPIISSLSEDAMYSVPDEDAMYSVPDSLRLSAYALGAKKYQVVTRVVLRAALPGIVAAYILRISWDWPVPSVRP